MPDLTDTEIDPETIRQWEEEFEAAARRPLEQRMTYAFIKTYKPVLDDAPFRAFDTMEEYRKWCEENLPGGLAAAEGHGGARTCAARTALGFTEGPGSPGLDHLDTIGHFG